MINAISNGYYTNEPNFKKRIDDTDPDNVYIWTTKAKNNINNTDKAIWDITLIKKVWWETLTWLKVDWKETWTNIWDDRTTYNYN